MLQGRSFDTLPERAALAHYCCAKFPLQVRNGKYNFILFVMASLFFACLPNVRVPSAYCDAAFAVIGRVLLCQCRHLQSCSFGLLCLFSPLTFQSSGTFPFALLMYSLSFSENDLLIWIMPFTLLFWYVGFPSAALAPSFQNLFVFLVSMPPAGILLFWLPTWVFVVYIVYRKHSCMLHRDTPETLQCKKKMWPSRGGGHRFRCFWSGTGRI